MAGRGRQGLQWAQGIEGTRQSPAEGRSWWQQEKDGFSSNSMELSASRKPSKVTAAPGRKPGTSCLSLGMKWAGERFLSECFILKFYVTLVEELLCCFEFCYDLPIWKSL